MLFEPFCQFVLQAPSDLILSKSISLSEALTGLNFHVRHLDGRVLEVLPIAGAQTAELSILGHS